tara:strand:- start:697 stop:924 length:228 start_codon:yes stop_codon:yes gene_type:complete
MIMLTRLKPRLTLMKPTRFAALYLTKENIMHRYTYKPTQEALEKRRAAAMDMIAVLIYSAALTVCALAYFDILTF